MITKMSSKDLEERLIGLNQTAKSHWQIDNGKLHKLFLFSDFAGAIGFMVSVSILADKINHHPEWSNVYNRVDVFLCTHDVDGITERDFDLARIMESCCR